MLSNLHNKKDLGDVDRKKKKGKTKQKTVFYSPKKTTKFMKILEFYFILKPRPHYQFMYIKTIKLINKDRISIENIQIATIFFSFPFLNSWNQQILVDDR